MATISKFYFHDATSTVAGTLPSAKVGSIAVDSTDTTANTNRTMDGTIGVLQVSCTADAANSTTNDAVFHRRFVSAGIAGQTIGGTWTFSGAESQNVAAKTPQQIVYLAVWRPGTGAKVGDLYTTLSNWTGGAATTEQAGSVTSLTLLSVTAQTGDVIIAEVYGSSNVVGAFTCQCYYDGTTEASTSSNAAFISFSNPIAMQDPFVLPGVSHVRGGLV